MRQVDPGPLVEIEFIHHRLNAFELHLQTEAIEVTVARMLNGKVHVRGSVIAAHAASEFVADGDSSATDQV